MMRLDSPCLLSPTLGVALVMFAAVAVGSAHADATSAVDASRASPMLLAGEIVLVPSRNGVPSSEAEASRQREMAREYRKGQVASTPPMPPAPSVIIVPEEEGVMSPRRGNPAAENSARARVYRQSESGSVSIPPQLVVPETSAPATESAAAQGARTNRARAIEYRKGEHSSIASVAVKGADGLPVIDCNAADNVAGRIGDDTRSGSVVILIQDRNQIKVRCR